MRAAESNGINQRVIRTCLSVIIRVLGRKAYPASEFLCQQAYGRRRKAVILISSELPEVLGMSDRVLVMKDDAIVAELTGEDINPVEVMRYAL